MNGRQIRNAITHCKALICNAVSFAHHASISPGRQMIVEMEAVWFIDSRQRGVYYCPECLNDMQDDNERPYDVSHHCLAPS